MRGAILQSLDAQAIKDASPDITNLDEVVENMLKFVDPDATGQITFDMYKKVMLEGLTDAC